MNSPSLPSSKKKMPKAFGRYVVSSLLGEGAMGRVYLATDPVLDRQVAIKVITIDAQTDSRTRQEYLSRFSVEAKASARLNHPSIVTIYDAGEERGIPWIAFEFIDGEPLQHALEQKEPIEIEKAIATTLDIAAALHHAHESGIIHRDIKPANILIDKRTGIAKLADFGVVKAPWVALTQDGNTVGSPGYISPEQLEGKGCDKRSDLFSLGIVLYQMLSGKHPFMRPTISATIFATLHGTYTPLEELRSDCPPYLIKIIATLLQNDPAKRFQSAAILLHELRTGSRAQQAPQTLDKNAFLGNTTRFHRISHVLRQKLEQKRRAPHLWSGILSTLALYGEKCSRQLLAATKNTQASLLIGVPAVLLFILIIFAIRTADERHVTAQLHQMGYKGAIPAVVDSCASMIACSLYTPVYTVAEHILGSSRYSGYGHLLTARAALNEGDDKKAIHALTQAGALRTWRSIKKENQQLLNADCSKRLTAKKADSSLIQTLSSTVLDNQHAMVSSWMYQKAYWLRWNSVRLASKLSVEVDSVRVYMLDLEHGGSVGTRTHAATRLGELGDKRAIQSLEKAANRGIRDPILSYTADVVLRNHFNRK